MHRLFKSDVESVSRSAVLNFVTLGVSRHNCMGLHVPSRARRILYITAPYAAANNDKCDVCRNIVCRYVYVCVCWMWFFPLSWSFCAMLDLQMSAPAAQNKKGKESVDTPPPLTSNAAPQGDSQGSMQEKPTTPKNPPHICQSGTILETSECPAPIKWLYRGRPLYHNF